MNFDFNLIVILCLFFVIAAVYSSAGFGGGSSYLAILTFLPLNFSIVKLTALTCNIAVVTSSLIFFTLKNKWTLTWIKKNLSILIVSIPCAFLAGTLKLSEHVFFSILGVVLIVSSLFMFFVRSVEDQKLLKRQTPILIDAGVGGVLGGFAGIVGIGGGIFLSPYLHLTNWSTAKNITICTSLFIFCNSLAGLGGQFLAADFSPDFMMIFAFIAVVLLGSQVGIRWRNNKFSNNGIRRITALVILIAGANILRKYWLQ